MSFLLASQRFARESPFEVLSLCWFCRVDPFEMFITVDVSQTPVKGVAKLQFILLEDLRM
jgi:hypothetical protein